MIKKVLITGVCGFIGYHLAKRLISENYFVVGVDNINDYYDINLKKSRLSDIILNSNFNFYKIDISDKNSIESIFSKYDFSIVFNLAAQAGVRYSIDNPKTYIDSNIVGFFNILECCRNNYIEHLLYASSSSVYGFQSKTPFSVNDNTDNPVSLYAATKKSNELMAYTYSHLFQIPVTGLRFFTVYGPFGRPDMAYFKFVKNIISGDPISVYNNGNMFRDFTYIDDIIESLYLLIDKIPDNHHRLLNIGNGSPITLIKFIEVIEDILNKKAIKKYYPMQPGDVPITYADIRDLKKLINFSPKTDIVNGLNKFIDWYKKFNKV